MLRLLVVLTAALGLVAALAGAASPAAPTLRLPDDMTLAATGPDGASVSYSARTDDGITLTCSQPPGATGVGRLDATFQAPIGTTTVECTAATNPAVTGTFDVTVVDGPPTLSMPAPISVTTSDPAGAAVTYTATASDAVSGSLTATCTPPSGSTFPGGTTTVACSATDGASNTTTGSFTVTVTVIVPDTTPPVLSLPGPISVTTENPSGRTVAFTASATDAVAGPVPVSCNPASGSNFAPGTTTVNCSASDGTNVASGSFPVTVTLVDATPPVFGGTPATIVREADGPTGSVVGYVAPTAVDAVDGPVTVGCTPPSGSRFPLGTTTVTCSASDRHGNSGSTSFSVRIVDTAAPTLTVPADVTVEGGSERGTAATFPVISSFLSAAVAVDAVDGRVNVATDAPTVFPVGSTTVTFTARDRSGNSASRTAHVTVLPPGTPAPPPAAVDRTPPQDVGNLVATAASRTVTLRWTPPASDFDHAVVLRAVSDAPSAPAQVYSGRSSSFVDRGVQNGLAYRYSVVAYDGAGNRSAGVAVVATPRLAMLLAPAEGARVAKPPALVWRSVRGARYYNLQLFRIPAGARSSQAVSADQKILSVWPAKTRFKLTRTWRYLGKRYRLSRGTYRWFVWPGFGVRADAKYGALLGQQSFVVR